ncbi:MAG: hypothetical protein MUP09_10645 [Thiovulaceae bacterium]|nr:hypothetical protein [Sulfurimonadaceae bacterium]
MNNSELERPMTIGDWILTWILLSIPVVGVIMLFVWALGSNVQKSKQNFARATFVVVLFWSLLFIFISMVGIGTPMGNY